MLCHFFSSLVKVFVFGNGLGFLGVLFYFFFSLGFCNGYGSCCNCFLFFCFFFSFVFFYYCLYDLKNEISGVRLYLVLLLFLLKKKYSFLIFIKGLIA